MIDKSQNIYFFSFSKKSHLIIGYSAKYAQPSFEMNNVLTTFTSSDVIIVVLLAGHYFENVHIRFGEEKCIERCCRGIGKLLWGKIFF